MGMDNPSTEKFSLKWNDFQDILTDIFRDLRNDPEFCDVTLACDDGQQMEAHKLILTASSPVLNTLLKRNKHSHPLIYMKGMKIKDLASIIDFIYYGEVNIYQEDLNEFLTTAEDLQIKGLTGKIPTQARSDSIEGYKSKNIINTTMGKNFQQKPAYIKKECNILDASEETKDYALDRLDMSEQFTDVNTYEESNGSVIYDIGSIDENKAINENESEAKEIVSIDPDIDLEELDRQIYSMMEKIGTLWTCKLCGKTADGGKRQNIKSHIESYHISGASHPCNDCNKTFKTRNSLYNHVGRLHK